MATACLRLVTFLPLPDFSVPSFFSFITLWILLRPLAPPTASTMEILQFVKSYDVDPIFFESSYYVAPDEKVSKPYALFLAALTETKFHAIARIAMHSREHVVIIRPAEGGLVLHTLYYPDELHKANQGDAPKAKLNTKELELAKSLISRMTAPFKPAEFHDTYRDNLERLIGQKQKGQKITAVKQPGKAPVIDLMEALKRSLKSSATSESSQPGSGSRRAGRKTAGRHKAA
jgi:DNA end-binding protein Ku